jgi:hypothetical protein
MDRALFEYCIAVNCARSAGGDHHARAGARGEACIDSNQFKDRH